MISDSITVFYSYAHEDEGMRNELAKHLKPLVREKIIDEWYDRKIEPSTKWNDEIQSKMDSADIILLLVSPDFLGSDYCAEMEIPMALSRHAANKAKVIPIILRTCGFQYTPLAALQCYPTEAKPVDTWLSKDAAYADVAGHIRAAVTALRKSRAEEREKKESNKAAYLKKATEVLSDGEILVGGRDTLDELQRELGLTPGEAAAIEAHAAAPIRTYKDNLGKYKGTLEKWIQQYPLSDKAIEDLKLRKRDLGLKDEDVERVEGPIKAQAEARYRDRLASRQDAVRTPDPGERTMPPASLPQPSIVEPESSVQAETSQVNLEEYKSAVFDLIAGKVDDPQFDEFKRGKEFKESLRALRKNLGLASEDCEPIERDILAKAKAHRERLDLLILARTVLGGNSDVFFSPGIPEKKAENAIASFGSTVAKKDILMLFDSTVFGSAKEGMIVTAQAIYWKNIMENPVQLPLRVIKEVAVSKRDLLINGNKFLIGPGIDTTELEALAEYVRLLASGVLRFEMPE